MAPFSVQEVSTLGNNVFLANDKPSTANEKVVEEIKPKPAIKAFGRVCKFKHMKGEVILGGRFENLKNLCKTMPAESDFIHGKHTLFYELSFPQ